MPSDIRDAILQIAIAHQAEADRRARLAGSQGQSFDPIDTLRAVQSDEAKKVYLPSTSAILRANLAEKMKMPGAGGGGSGGDVQTIAAQMLKAGEAPADITKAVSQYEQARDRNAVGKKPGAPLWRRAMTLPTAVGFGALKGLGKTLEYAGRPGMATTAVVRGIMDLDSSKNTGDILENMGINALKGLSGEDRRGGMGIVEQAGWKDTGNIVNRIARSATAFGTDIAFDPTSYLSFGATSTAGKIAQNLGTTGLSKGVQHAARTQAKNIIRTTESGALRGTKRLVKEESDDIVNAGLAAHRAEELKNFERARKYPNSGYSSDMYDIYKAEKAAGKADDLAEAAAMQQLNASSNVVYDTLTQAIEPGTHSAFQLKLGFMGRGKDVLEGTQAAEKIARPFEWGADKFAKTGLGDFMGNHFKYEKLFPGQLAYIRNKAASLGVAFHDDLRQRVHVLFKDVDVDTRKAMAHAIESNTPMANPRLEAIRQEAIQLFKDMGDDSVRFGVNDSNKLLKDGYVYHYYKSYGKRKAADKAIKGNAEGFRTLRKQQIQAGGGNANFTLKDAIAEGLSPEEDLAKIILAKGAKHNRDVVRNKYLTDLTLNHAQKFSKKMSNAREYGLEVVPDKYIPPNVRTAMNLGKDEALYMPKQYLDSIERLGEIMSIGTGDETAKRMFRVFDTVNRGFKYSKTIARPSYHVNNMSSDMMFGFFDNTPIHGYARSMKNYIRANAGKTTEIALGKNHSITYDEMVDLYRKNAGGTNFFSTEMPLGVTGEGKISRVNQFAHSASQKREDWARYTHFESAVQQEFKKIAKDRTLQPYQMKQTLDKAVQNATRRVNKFNIDYNALTPFESTWMRRAIPFYTYMRKATPLILQSAYLTPGRVLLLDKERRLTENLLGINHNESFDNLRFPEWMRQGAGFAQLSSDKNPLALNLSSMPQSLLADRFGGSSPQEMVKDQLAMTNLVLRAGPEFVQGRNYFTGQKIKDPVEYLGTEFNPLVNFMPGKKNMNVKKWGGLPISSISKEQQLASIKKATDKEQVGVSALNKLLEDRGYSLSKVNKKKGTVYRVADKLSGKILGEYANIQAAQQAANKLTGQ